MMIVVANNVLCGISPVVLLLRREREREEGSDRQTMIDLVDYLYTVNDKFLIYEKQNS
jgi:hypothetical protein